MVDMGIFNVPYARFRALNGVLGVGLLSVVFWVRVIVNIKFKSRSIFRTYAPRDRKIILISLGIRVFADCSG